MFMYYSLWYGVFDILADELEVRTYKGAHKIDVHLCNMK